MTKLLLYIKTLFKLGIYNVLYVLWYRFTLKSGIRKSWFPIKNIESAADFFTPCQKRTDYPLEWKHALIQEADKILSGQFRYYAHHWKQIGNPPNWFLNPFNNKLYPNTLLHWTNLPDFHPEVGDIKNIWETSRFEWVVTLARAYTITGESKYLTTFNTWLKDWSKHNPLNAGPHWKCGQEASIRVFNLINTAFILQQHTTPTTELKEFVNNHLSRISKNIRYAIVQDNNHGTSEAAGLFIGGSWLNSVDAKHYPLAKHHASDGRYWLENRVEKLISTDGSFSQHSVNYHRVMLDTLSYCEFWRVNLSLELFSQQCYSRVRSATNWLNNITDSQNGLTPNLGANDGALLLHTNSCPYRDVRPSVQLAGLLFFKLHRFPPGLWNESLYWFNLSTNPEKATQHSNESLFISSGYVTIKNKQSWALIRFPYFKYRPSHNDVFHVDLWYQGENVLCDAGSYSYNPPPEEKEIDLKSVHHHNTVSFDNQEQMPKISRFLLGNWLKPEFTGSINTDIDGTTSWKSSYIDNNHNRHQRTISVKNNTWTIEDTLTGNFKTATIGFNLNTTDAQLEGNTCTTPFSTITFNANSQPPIAIGEQPILTLTNTIISMYYFQKRSINRLNIQVSHPGTYITKIILATDFYENQY